MRDTQKSDYYSILKLSPTATDLEIKSQYRRLSKRYHPDMGGSQADMANINEAYHVLSDSFRRSIYDAEQRRTLHVPAREPKQPTHTSQRKQPVARQYTYSSAKQSTPKHKRSWWATLSWSFAIVVILVGILLQLPLAEANGSSDKTTQPTPKPLSVNYPSDNSKSSSVNTSASAATNSTFYTAPDDVNSSAPAATNTQLTPIKQQATCGSSCSTADNSCSDTSCQQSQTDKNCITKTVGLYKHTTCSTSGSTNSCTTNAVGTHRYTMCY